MANGVDLKGFVQGVSPRVSIQHVFGFVATNLRVPHVRLFNSELTRFEPDMWLRTEEIDAECLDWGCCSLPQQARSGNRIHHAFADLGTLVFVFMPVLQTRNAARVLVYA